MQLSIEGERKLKQTLYESLQNQAIQVAEAYAAGNQSHIQQIGHSLRGNSGAAYFNLTQVATIGTELYQNKDLDEAAFSTLLAELHSIVQQLEREIGIKD